MAKFSDDAVRIALCGSQTARRYPFPGKPAIEVAIKLLTDSEIDDIRLRAAEVVKMRKAELLIDPEFFDRIIQREYVARAYYDAENDDEAFFGDQSEVAQLDNLTVRALFEQYMLHAAAMDPYAHCPADMIEELADTLGKSENSAGLLSLYDGQTAKLLLLSTALKLRETLALLK